MTFVLAAVQQPAGGGSSLGFWLPLQILGFVAIFYFLIFRPQAEARKKHAAMLAEMKKGDEVMTAGGIIGKVKDIKEVPERKETRVTIESGSSTIVVERSRIIRIGETEAPGAR